MNGEPIPSLELGVIGNCAIAALIDRRARIAWACFPRLDGDPVFCSLLEPKNGGGMFDIELEGLRACMQRYRRNTAVLETELADAADGRIRVTDFAPRFKQFGRVYRPAMIVRRVEPLAGRPRIRVRVAPRFRYGEELPQKSYGSNHIRYQSSEMTLRLTTDAPLAYLMEEAAFTLEAPLHFVFGMDESVATSITLMCADFLDQTGGYWRDWSRFLNVPFEWQDTVIRSAITLKLSSLEDTGGIVAALTASIPEAPGTGRNWDYRYCWLRDAYFVVRALNRVGATKTMESLVHYVSNVVASEAGGALKPVYALVPERPLPEREAPALRGYRGEGPVRIGNDAARQRQNDVYGSVLLAVEQAFFDDRLPSPAGAALFEQLEPLGERAVAAAFTPDAGIWEYRGRARVHTHSAMLCWAACHRLGRIAARLGAEDRVGRWHGEAERIKSRILTEAWNAETGAFVESLGGRELDASLLLMGEIGFLRANDPRFVATVEAIGKTLLRDGNIFRYREADDFGTPATAFTGCTFWYIDALAAIGRRGEARELFEALLARRTRLGLLSEDIDVATGGLWGNFPQTYAMAGIVLSAMRLSRTWEESLWNA